MNTQTEKIAANLLEVKKATDTDFVAFAWADGHESIMKWKYVAGNRNERYRRILLTTSKGIIGNVVRLGRPVSIPSFCPRSGEDPTEYSILLAEGLQSLLAVPVLCSLRIKGIILVGCRYARNLEAEVPQLKEVAVQLEQVMNRRLDSY